MADARAAAAPRPPPAAYAASQPVHRAGAWGELVLLAAHLVMIASAALTMQPLNRWLSWQAYFLFCRTSLVASVYKVGGGGRG